MVVEGGVHFAVRSAGLTFALVVIVFQDIGFVILFSLHHGRLILYPLFVLHFSGKVTGLNTGKLFYFFFAVSGVVFFGIDGGLVKDGAISGL